MPVASPPDPGPPLAVEVLDDPATAAIALDPVRARLLGLMGEPISAAALAGRVDLTRQKVNYHLRTLEARGLVAPAGERRWGGITERLLVASASSYVVGPGAVGAAAADPAGMDRLSAGYLVAVAARVVGEVGALIRRARATDKRVATLALDTQVRFATPADRAAFAGELTAAVTGLVARYHDESAPEGRWHRVVVGAHPVAAPVPEAMPEVAPGSGPEPGSADGER